MPRGARSFQIYDHEQVTFAEKDVHVEEFSEREEAVAVFIDEIEHAVDEDRVLLHLNEFGKLRPRYLHLANLLRTLLRRFRLCRLTAMLKHLLETSSSSCSNHKLELF